MKNVTDIWQTGLVRRTIADVMKTGVDGADILWLPEPGPFRFNADPFGLWHNGLLTVLVEAYDYRTKHGEIHYYSYDPDWNLAGQGVALREPFHLSYPQIIRDGDHVYLLPEAHRSGKLTLYRAIRFPDRWQPMEVLMEAPAIDATVAWHAGRWWMFYALPGPDQQAMRELHVAYADAVTGPWHPHDANPVLTGIETSRPGGTPFAFEGALHLPVQDCAATYGAAVNVLKITELTPERFAASIVKRFEPGIHPNFRDGLHTLAAAGDVTLIDVKRLDKSSRLWVDLERRLNRFLGKEKGTP